MNAFEDANNDSIQYEPRSHLSPEENLPSEQLLSEGLKNLSCKNMFSYSTAPARPQREISKKWTGNEHTTLKPEDVVDDMLKNNWNTPSAPENTDVKLSRNNSLPTDTSRRKSVKQDWETKDPFSDLNIKLSSQDENNKFADDWIKYIEVKPIVPPQPFLKTSSEPSINESPAQSAETRLCTASSQSVKDLGLWSKQSAVNFVPDSPNPPNIIDLTDEPSAKKIKPNGGYNQDTKMNKQEIQLENAPIVPIRSPIRCAPVVCHPNPPIVPVRPPIQCAPAFCHQNPMRLPDFTALQSSSRKTNDVYQELTTQNGHFSDSIDPLVVQHPDKHSIQDYKNQANNFVREITIDNEKNERKWVCTFPNCASSQRDGYKEAVRAKTHVMAEHLGIQYACPEESCNYTCNRIDNLSSHTTRHHKSREYPYGYTLVIDKRYKDSPVKVDRYVKKKNLKRQK